MTISYVNFMKHANHVTKTSSNSRPVLKGVMHREGNLIVTDSHRLYVGKEIYEGSDKNLNPKTGDVIEGNYPDVDRLLPEPSSAKLSVSLNTDLMYKVLKVIEAAGKIDKASNDIEITLEENVLKFYTGDQSQVFVNYDIPVTGTYENFTIYANVLYVVQALALMKDAGETCNFNFYGIHRPFTFTADNVITLILPIRKV